jgi:large subunit ribosomal protein L5
METRTPRLKKLYHDEVVKGLQEKFQYKSSMQVPKLVKIAINQGLGAATQDKKW